MRKVVLLLGAVQIEVCVSPSAAGAGRNIRTPLAARCQGGDESRRARPDASPCYYWLTLQLGCDIEKGALIAKDYV